MLGVRNRFGNVGVAVVGLGYWGPNLVRNLVGLPRANLVAVCDQRTETLRTVSRRFGLPRTTTRFDDLLESEAVEAIVIATPLATHHELASAALAAGKHVLVEKPLAASVYEARDLLEAPAPGQILMCGHTFLYSPAVNRIRDLVIAGEIGDTYFVSMSRVNLGVHRSDTSVVWDLGPHDFSILAHWLGELPTSVTALARDCVGSGRPDVAFLLLEYASGVIAHVELSWLAPSKLRRTTVVGSRKMIVYDDTSNEPVRIFDSGVSLPSPESFGEYRLTYRTGDIVSPRVEPQEPLQLELIDFLAAIRDGTEPRSNGRLGLDVVILAEAAERSLQAGGVKVMIGAPLKNVEPERAPASPGHAPL
jgi:predicted dehydrogenase